jgi:hypothetical protein
MLSHLILKVFSKEGKAISITGERKRSWGGRCFSQTHLAGKLTGQYGRICTPSAFSSGFLSARGMNGEGTDLNKNLL